MPIAVLQRTRKAGSDLLRRASIAWRLTARAFPTVGRLGDFCWEVLKKYNRDDCWTYAASLSFFLTISLVPLATLFFKLLALSVGHGPYGQTLQGAMFKIYPYLPENFLHDTVSRSKQMGGLGFSWIILLVGAHWGVNQLDRSLSHIFDLRIKPHRQTRGYHLFRRLAIVLGGLCFMIILLTAGFEWTLRRGAPLSPILMYDYLPPLLALLVGTLVLQHLPRRHVKFKHAFLGALVAATLWWLAKWTFGIYLAHAPTFGILYGSLKSLMAGLIFLYYSCCIFLLGAEVTAAFYRHDTTMGLQIPSYLRKKLDP